MATTIQLLVNGKKVRLEADAGRSLLGVLREDLALTGSKYGCGEGQCGACTVLVDGLPRRSCVTLLRDVAGKRITTVEGLGSNGSLHPLQQAFLEAGAMQCGYCTPGMIVSGVGLLNKIPDPTDQDILRFMEGNVCRCGVYPRIVAAIKSAAKRMKETAR